MAEKTLLDKVHDLSDLELAALICLVAQENCIIDTEPDALDDLVQELELVIFDHKTHNTLLLTLSGSINGLRLDPCCHRLL